ncbi:MAG TPA: ADOP family duplicated permease [Gemmatimonadaceae bacterium]|jgi:putative ABC transport system permease protein|nr:ADOP family duplicated permease [Gemmatimonadaceae bacterium]
MTDHLRRAARSLIRTPGFTVVATLVLGLSIAVCTVTFSIVNAVYFRVLPYRDQARLAIVQEATGPIDMAPAALRTWREGMRPIADVAAGAEYWGVLATGTETTYGVGAAVTGNFFDLLGVRPWLGRSLTTADDQPGATRVMVLDYAFWREAFSGDTAVIGQSVRLDGHDYEIIGVLPPESGIGRPILDVDDPATAPTVPFIIPIGSSELGAAKRPATQFRLVARLDPGRTIGQLAASASVLGVRVADPHADAPPRMVVSGVRHLLSQEYGGAYPLFLGAVLLVLAVACGSIAGLFLVRFHARQREILICAALGAGRRALVTRLVLEPVVIAAVGGGLGVSLAFWGIHLDRLLPTRAVPYWTHVAVDTNVLLFALAATATSALTFGVGPALLMTRRRSGLAVTPGRDVVAAKRALVTLEIALTLVLLTSAGLLGETFLAASGRDTGMAKDHLATGLLDVHAEPDRRAVALSLLDHLSRLPSVSGAALRGEADLPRGSGLIQDGDVAMIAAGVAHISVPVVSPGFFRTVGARLIRGREFTEADGPQAPPVAILSDSTARRFFPNQDPIGRRVMFGPASAPSWITIVGVAGEIGHPLTTSRAAPYRPTLYRPIAQVSTSHVRFLVRTHGPSAALLTPIRAAIRSVVPDAPLVGLTTVDEATDRQLAPLRSNALVVSTLALLTLGIAALGIYGMVGYLVEQRTNEIGLRMALGARPIEVIGLALRFALGATVMGILCGMLGAYLLAQLLRSLIYDTSPSDPRIFAAAATVFAAVALAAAYVPARRATRIDPARALRV